MNAVQKLRQMVGEVRKSGNPLQAHASWDLVRGLLGRMPVDMAEARRVCDALDVDGFEALVVKLEELDAQQRGAAKSGGGGGAGTSKGAGGRVPPPSPEMAHQMDAALRAFRKRLKMTRLSDESKLGGRQLTSGKRSQVDAILPPHEFSDEVWKALAAAGKLVHTGQGFYSLVGDEGGSAAREEPLV